MLLPWHLSEKYKGASTMIRIIKKDTFGASTMSSRLKKELICHKTFWCFYHEFRTQKRFSLIYIFGASTMSSRLKKDLFYDFLLYCYSSQNWNSRTGEVKIHNLKNYIFSRQENRKYSFIADRTFRKTLFCALEPRVHSRQLLNSRVKCKMLLR